jgi:hypothetical protein
MKEKNARTLNSRLEGSLVGRPDDGANSVEQYLCGSHLNRILRIARELLLGLDKDGLKHELDLRRNLEAGKNKGQKIHYVRPSGRRGRHSGWPQ